MKRVALVCPGIGGMVAGGGWALFRSLALVLRRLTNEVFILGPGGPMDDFYGFMEIVADGVLDRVEELAPDLVVKVAGALRPEEDERLDRLLLGARSQYRGKVVYFDGDAPSRIPMLWYQPTYYLSEYLGRGIPVVLWGGGPRALHGYRAAGAEKVFYLRAPLLYRGVEHAIMCADIRIARFDRRRLISDITVRDERRVRVDTLFAQARSGGIDTHISNRRVNPVDWLKELVDAGMVLNVVRSDVQGFTDLSASRVFEAVACDALLVSEWYPGIDSVVPEPFRVPLPQNLSAWQSLSGMSEVDFALKTRAARSFLKPAADEAFMEAVDLFQNLL